jgi:hypothetical protein
MSLLKGAIINIQSAERIADYKLRLTFSDGAERTIDFEPFLRASSNPQIRAYLDAVRFASFRIEDGDLIWDDYGLCFPIADLYEDKV